MSPIALQQPHAYWPFPRILFHMDSGVVLTINDNTDEIALPFTFPASGTLTHAMTAISSSTTTGTCDYRIETIASDGTPSGTL